MRRVLIIASLGLLWLSAASPVRAVTVSASPNPVHVGESTTIGFTYNQGASFCNLTVDFGDGSSTTVGSVSGSGTRNVSHSYSSVGNKTVTISGGGGCGITPPIPVSYAVTVIPAPAPPPPPPSPTPTPTPPPTPISGAFGVVASPATARIARGEASVVRIEYRATAAAGASGAVTSADGSFQSGGAFLGAVGGTVSIPISSGQGRASEALTIPFGVVEQALRAGSTRLTFTRTFRGSGGTATTHVEITIAAGSVADFAIQRLELSFENHLAVVTLPRGARGPQATARIRYVGAGLLEGVWEVDGVRFAPVVRQFSSGAEATIESPDAPPFPTETPGAHVVRFVPTRPIPTAPLPEIVYFVVDQEAGGPVGPLSLVAPADGAVAGGESSLSWEKAAGAAIYLVQLLDKPEGKVLFSAYTRELSYRVPVQALQTFLPSEISCFWQVSGLDTEHRRVAVSRPRRLMLR